MTKLSWPHKEAQRLFDRVRNTNKSIVFETGYGPSGLPHIGTFAEVARTTFVINAFKHAFPEFATRLIVFSDDMDGLRSLPENIPNHALIRPHLGAPLSSIPDPFGKEGTFSEFMNKQLQSFLDYYGFEYEFRSSTEAYKSGKFDAGLRRVMDCYEPIRDLFTSTISEEKRENWNPFFPICESCGKIYTTRVTAVDKLNYRISYRCDHAEGKYTPCGHTGTTDITGGKVKVGWKVDWALRWYVLGIDYEMYGKDLISSYAVSQRICSILGSTPPIGYKYELFLDENGAKISKKIGNGISIEQWQTYAPLGAMLHFLLENPNKARRMGLPILPKIVDDYIKALRTEDRNDVHGYLWFVDKFQHHHDARGLENSEIGYGLLTNVAENLGLHDGAVLYEYAARQDPSVRENEPFFMELCHKVIAYVRGYQEKLPKETVHIDNRFIPYLLDLRQFIQALIADDSFEANNIQNAVFAVAKTYHLDNAEWFKFLYSVLVGKEKGSRMGTFLAVLGGERVMSMFDQALSNNLAGIIGFDAVDLEKALRDLLSKGCSNELLIQPIVNCHNENEIWRSQGKALLIGPWNHPLIIDGYQAEFQQEITEETAQDCVYARVGDLLKMALAKLDCEHMGFRRLPLDSGLGG